MIRSRKECQVLFIYKGSIKFVPSSDQENGTLSEKKIAAGLSITSTSQTLSHIVPTDTCFKPWMLGALLDVWR